jgi:DNA end-binding protein Ku
MLDKLYYPDEVRTQDKPSVPDVLVSKQELNMAYSLIDLLQEPFEPEKYDDAYRSAVLDLIEAKKKGKKVVSAAPSTAKEPTDLMAALKASLEAAQKGKRPSAPVKDDDADDAPAPKKSSKRKSPEKPAPAARKLRKAS